MQKNHVRLRRRNGGEQKKRGQGGRKNILASKENLQTHEYT